MNYVFKIEILYFSTSSPLIFHFVWIWIKQIHLAEPCSHTIPRRIKSPTLTHTQILLSYNTKGQINHWLLKIYIEEHKNRIKLSLDCSLGHVLLLKVHFREILSVDENFRIEWQNTAGKWKEKFTQFHDLASLCEKIYRPTETPNKSTMWVEFTCNRRMRH